MSQGKTSTAEFLSALRRQGITLSMHGERLRVSADSGVLNAELKQAISERKAEILDFLSQLQSTPSNNTRIQAAPRQLPLPLSFAQQRLWFLDQLVGRGPTYNISGALQLDGALNLDALKNSLQAVIQRHEVLRTVFTTDDGQPYQQIRQTFSFDLPLSDLSYLMEPSRQQALDQFIGQQLLGSFDLQQDLMLRANIVKLANNQHVLVLIMHHIVADGWSIGVLVDELQALYQAFVNDQASPLPPLPLQYADYAYWQREYLQGDHLERQLSFWRQQLADAPPMLAMPTDKARPAQESFNGAHISFQLPSDLSHQLKQLSLDHNVTLYMVLLAVFKLLLYRYSGQQDIVVGSPIANRNRKEIEPLLGFFVNTLALRSDLSGNPPFIDFLQSLSHVIRQAYDHQDLPFERLVEELQPERNMSHAPLFQTAFALQNAPRPPFQLSGLTLTPIELDNHTSKFDLFLSLYDETDGLKGVWEFATDLFEVSTIERFTQHYQTLLAAIIKAPNTPIEQLDMLSEAERRQQLMQWNRHSGSESRTEWPHLHQVVQQYAEQYPHQLALQYQQQRLSYSELDQQANQLAHCLIGQGVEPGQRIGISLLRSPQMIISLLAILKSGCAFVPLDPNYPQDRLHFMASDANVSLILSHSNLVSCWLNNTYPLLCLDQLSIAEQPLQAPDIHIDSDDSAYVIYTSGSTGIPKGVELGHRGLACLLDWQRSYFQIDKSTQVLQFSTLNFDASIWEVSMAFSGGGCLHLVDLSLLTASDELIAYMTHQAISHITLPPSFLAAMPRTELPALRCLIVAGEAVPIEVIHDWAPGRRFFNAYGPTEATVCASIAECSDTDQKVTIGRPMASSELYILNPQQQPVPVNASGELYIGGPGLAKQYLNQTTLYQERFVNNPFGTGLLYRSGDLARFTRDGEIEFLGRVDDQIKLRGFRIELGEIENVICDYGWIREAAVLAREDQPGERRLVAYLRPSLVDNSIDNQRLQEWQNLFQTTYDDAKEANPEEPGFNIAGWGSSYTGEAIPADDMREWVERTVSDIQKLIDKNTKNILEIGCGTGLLFNRLMDHDVHYHGTDISEAAIDYVSQLAIQNGQQRRCRFNCQPADNFNHLDEGQYDLIIINSVVQYFPSIQYLHDVLSGLVKRLSPGGRLFIGDVRNYALLEAYHSSVQIYRATDDTTQTQLRSRIRQHLLDEEELLVDPSYFYALEQQLGGLHGVDIDLKRGYVRNELSSFRYQVILYSAKPTTDQAMPNIEWAHWRPAHDSLQGLQHQLLNKTSTVFAIRNIPNHRLQAEAMMLNWLDQTQDQTITEYRRQSAGASGIEPEDLHQLVANLPYVVSLTWPASGDVGYMDAVFIPSDSMLNTRDILTRHSEVLKIHWQDYANNPLFGRLNQTIIPSLRDFLQSRLPEHMLPASYVLLEQFPLTSNGKIDRRALPAPDWNQRSHQNRYIPPSNTTETILVKIWQDVLNLEQVGIQDNFFEIGGDSIISIQIVARAKQAGLQLATRDLFEHQTVASLAQTAVAIDNNHQKESSVPVVGTAKTTPIQSWFLQSTQTDPHYFNQCILLEMSAALVVDYCRDSLLHLINHHDALRSTFSQQSEHNNEWIQHYSAVWEASDLAQIFQTIDLSTLDSDQQLETIQTQTAALQSQFNLHDGPLMQIALFERGSGQNKILFWTIHHLVIDAVSWRILFEDFSQLYQQLSNQTNVVLPNKTTSFKSWSNSLQQWANDTQYIADQAYWQNLSNTSAELPLDYPVSVDSNSVASVTTVECRLTQTETEQLLRQAPATYRTQINDLLLSALLPVMSRWTGQPSVWIDLEGHGREPLQQNIDLSRTVGWFTCLYPVQLTLNSEHIGERIKSVKEQLRAVPDKGLGYGVLRYLNHDDLFSECPRPQVAFNYLGQFTHETDPGSLVVGYPDWDTGSIHSPNQQRSHLLQINGSLLNGELIFRWNFSKQLHHQDTIQSLAEGFTHQLQLIIEHCIHCEYQSYTPSDFPAATIDQIELDQLLAKQVNAQQIEDVYDLSPLQQGLLFESLNTPQSGLYMEQIVLSLNGPLRADALQWAWQQIVDRHAIFRTGFFWENQQHTSQVVFKQSKLPFTQLDWRECPKHEQQQRFEAFLTTDRQRDFNVTRPPLMRFNLIRMSNDDYQLVWTSHHILMDGWCTPILFKELLSFYRAAIDDEIDSLSLQPAIPYRDYIVWRQQLDIVAAEQYWRQQLDGFETPSRLSHIAFSADDRRQCAQLRIQLSDIETEALQQLAQGQRLTLNSLIQAVWSLLLAYQTGQNDIVFGTTVSGRPADLDGVESMLGLFINTLAVRVSINWDQPLLEWLQQIHHAHLQRSDYAYSSLMEVQTYSDVPRGTSLFDNLLVFENFPFDESLQQASLHHDVAINSVESSGETSFPMTAVASLYQQQLSVRLTYDQGYFESTQVKRIADQLRQLFQQLCAVQQDQKDSVKHLSPLDPIQTRQILEGWNQTDYEYPVETLIHQMFETQAEQIPERTAVVCGEQQINYQQLDQRANLVARQLQQQGVLSGDFVGLHVNRSIDAIVGIIGILKAGAAFVPLDPSWPIERLKVVAATTGMHTALTDHRTAHTLPVTCLSLIDMASSDISNSRDALCDIDPQQAAYVIFTSGSTGQPKGVTVEHRQLSNYCQAIVRRLELDPIQQHNPPAGFASVSTLAADLGHTMLFPCLCTGGTLHLMTEQATTHPDTFAHYFLSHSVDYLKIVPSHFNALLSAQDPAAVIPQKQLILGGEVLPVSLVKRVQALAPGCSIINHYGPTETTVGVTTCQVDALDHLGEGNIPIGRPLDNTRIYLLNDADQPVPMGAPGEIFVAGANVSRGYIGQPELTRERFVDNPFGTGKLYRTGDLARYRDDGLIEFLGRTDQQVKIRGYRVELSEINTLLKQHDAIHDAVVVSVTGIGDGGGDTGAQRLAAYVVLDSTQDNTQDKGQWSDQWRLFLQQQLPDYMLPSQFIIIENIPLTSNGKLNKNALPKPKQDHAHRHVAPQTDVEQALARVWQQLLHVEQVGIEDNFFELGGDSIISIQIVARAAQAGWQLTTRQIFEHQTIAALARVTTQASAPRAEQGAITGPVPLTPIQHAFVARQLPEAQHYNQAMMFRVPAHTQPSLLGTALQAVMQHHDMLRLQFDNNLVDPKQSLVGPEAVDIAQVFNMIDLSDVPTTEQHHTIQQHTARLQASLSLRNGPITKLSLFRLQPEQTMELHWVIHHLAVDGVSWRVLLEDLNTAYQQLHQAKPIALPSKTSAFKHWAEYLQTYAQSDEVIAQIPYWQKTVGIEPEYLPLDFPNATENNTVACSQRITTQLSSSNTKALLQEASVAYNTRINDLLLTALTQTFSAWTGKHELYLDLEGHGRELLDESLDLSRTVGWFTSLFPLRLSLTPQQLHHAQPGDAIKAIKEQLRLIPQHGIGYGVLRYLNHDIVPLGCMSNAPPAPIVFNYLGQFDNLANQAPSTQSTQQASLMAGISSFDAGPMHNRQQPRQHLILVNALVLEGRLHIHWDYSERLFHAETIQQLATQMNSQLQKLIEHCLSPDAGGHTPSDFELANIDDQALSQLADLIQDTDQF